MLTPYTQSKFIEKVCTDRNGQQFRLVFFVALVNGEVTGRLISAQPIGKAPQTVSAEEILYLPIAAIVNDTVTEYVSSFAPIVSSYNKFFFFNSQPTRAPSYNF